MTNTVWTGPDFHQLYVAARNLLENCAVTKDFLYDAIKIKGVGMNNFIPIRFVYY